MYTTSAIALVMTGLSNQGQDGAPVARGSKYSELEIPIRSFDRGKVKGSSAHNWSV